MDNEVLKAIVEADHTQTPSLLAAVHHSTSYTKYQFICKHLIIIHRIEADKNVIPIKNCIYMSRQNSTSIAKN